MLWGDEPGVIGAGLLAGASQDDGFEMLDDSSKGEPVWVMDDLPSEGARRSPGRPGSGGRPGGGGGSGLAAIKRSLPQEVVAELLDTECLILDVIRCTREVVALGNERLRGEAGGAGGRGAAAEPLPAQALVLYFWSLRLLLGALSQLRELKSRWMKGGWAVPEKLVADWRSSLVSHLTDDYNKAKLAMRMGISTSQGTECPWVTSGGGVNEWAVAKPATPSAQHITYLTAVRGARTAACGQKLFGLEAEEAQGSYWRSLLLLCALMLDLPATSSDRKPLEALASLLAPRVPSPPDPCTPSTPGVPKVSLSEALVRRCARGGRFWALSQHGPAAGIHSATKQTPRPR
ncbi:hypothetical protein T484DRAFT_1932228 [Baffinella frigidus]|nr:hypothetical protein T484DRAFT_1932228 [Cryptophyta sp. CCMP2293]